MNTDIDKINKKVSIIINMLAFLVGSKIADIIDSFLY